MVAISSANNFSITELTSLLNQIGVGGTSFKVAGANFNIGELLSGAQSVYAVKNGNQQQKEAGVQSLVNQIVSLVSKIANAQADADNKVKENQDAVKEVDKKVKKTEADLKLEIKNAGEEIAAQTAIVDTATGVVADNQEELVAKIAEIKAAKEEIVKKQSKLAAATTNEEKESLLGEIKGQADIILSASGDIANLQGLIAAEEENIVKATAGIEAAQGRTVEVQQQAVSEIANAAQEGTQATVNIVKTQAEGTKDVAAGQAIEAAAATASATGVGAIVGAPTAQKGAELIAAGTTKIGGSIGNLNGLKTVITGMASNSALLNEYNTTIGGALGNFNNAIGGWNDAITPFITSIGSLDYTAYGSEATRLKGVVGEDELALGISQPDKGSDNNVEVSDNTQGQESEVAPVDQVVQNVELKTPKFQFGI